MVSREALAGLDEEEPARPCGAAPCCGAARRLCGRRALAHACRLCWTSLEQDEESRRLADRDRGGGGAPGSAPVHARAKACVDEVRRRRLESRLSEMRKQHRRRPTAPQDVLLREHNEIARQIAGLGLHS